jgi:sugar (pentulose or hexulose) kinase
LEHDLFGKPVSTFSDHALMNDRDYRDEIVRLEGLIDELAARIENCRKFILAGRILVIGGGVVLVAMLIGVLQLNPSVMAVAVAAVLGGIVAAGSSHSTAKEATHELTAAEAKRTTLIGHIDLRLVSDHDGPQ